MHAGLIELRYLLRAVFVRNIGPYCDQLELMPFASTFKLAHGVSRQITAHSDDTTDSKVIKMERMTQRQGSITLERGLRLDLWLAVDLHC
jgi:hypothetical protein